MSVKFSGNAGDRVVVDTARCQGYGMCVGFHSGVFDLPPTASVVTVIRDRIEEDDRPDVEEAILSCPAQAISLTSRGS
jgi:ferredoxin